MMKGVSVPIPSWPWWLLVGGKDRESVSNGADALKFPSKITSCNGTVKRRWMGKGEMRNEVDHETLSLSEGGKSWSGSEADGPEWSVGWTEPHGPDFESNDEGDSGFLVLVPCYRAVVEEGSSNKLLSAVKNFPTRIPPDGNNYVEQWLSTLHDL